MRPYHGCRIQFFSPESYNLAYRVYIGAESHDFYPLLHTSYFSLGNIFVLQHVLGLFNLQAGLHVSEHVITLTFPSDMSEGSNSMLSLDSAQLACGKPLVYAIASLVIAFAV